MRSCTQTCRNHPGYDVDMHVALASPAFVQEALGLSIRLKALTIVALAWKIPT